MQVLQDTSILVLGLGASGLAMARWCYGMQGRVSVVDTRDHPPGLDVLTAEFPQIQFRTISQFSAELLAESGARAICRSPGLPPQQVAELFEAAKRAGIPIWGELDLFMIALKSLEKQQGYAPKILAISGTNGKTTVTSLTGQLVERAGKSVQVAGNIGPTLLDTLSGCVSAAALPQVWVLELSSFQLDGVCDFTPAMGVVLNLTQDHLDWHGSMEAYTAAKACVFGPHTPGAPPMLLNRDDPLVMGMRAPLLKGKPQRGDITFGADLPTRPGDYGLETVNGMTWLVRALEADETIKRRRNEEAEIHIQRLIPADALRIRGRHNALNALAALALASAADCSLSHILFGLREYRGEPHRVESLGIVDGVEYFDDSKGTNVGATVAALTGLGAQSKLVVIMGGEGKGQDFSPLALPVSRFARGVVLIGRDALAIEEALLASAVPIQRAQTLEQAVAIAATIAHVNDVVLLSPACASFDMFRDYVHRAQVFSDAVQGLAQKTSISISECG